MISASSLLYQPQWHVVLAHVAAGGDPLVPPPGASRADVARVLAQLAAGVRPPLVRRVHTPDGPREELTPAGQQVLRLWTEANGSPSTSDRQGAGPVNTPTDVDPTSCGLPPQDRVERLRAVLCEVAGIDLVALLDGGGTREPDDAFLTMRVRDRVRGWREDNELAWGLVRKMHAAAVGEERDPARGYVEDVADLRARLVAVEDMLAQADQPTSRPPMRLVRPGEGEHPVSFGAVAEVLANTTQITRAYADLCRAHNDTGRYLAEALQIAREAGAEATKLRAECDQLRVAADLFAAEQPPVRVVNTPYSYTEVNAAIARAATSELLVEDVRLLAGVAAAWLAQQVIDTVPAVPEGDDAERERLERRQARRDRDAERDGGAAVAPAGGA